MIRIASLIGAMGMLGACVSVLPQPAAPEALYRFGPMTQMHRLDASILVREPEASRLFSGRALAAEDGTGALRLLRGVEWTDSATRMMQVALLDMLGGAGRNAAVAAETGAPADYELVWRISDFTVSGTTARCQLEATLLKGRSRAVLSQTSVATTALALDGSNAARARALTDAGRACVSEIGAFVADQARMPAPATE